MGVCSNKCIVEAAVTKDLREALRKFCQKKGVSISGGIREMIEEKVYSVYDDLNSDERDYDLINSVYGGRK